ncbi:MAG: hypothetical protein ILA03_05000 [Bacteroidaceae bacterium]|nr:hypothetical protein [Bacteroidaceae bacterium]
MGPWPMQLVVLMAVNAAVRTDIASWITDFLSVRLLSDCISNAFWLASDD